MAVEVTRQYLTVDDYYGMAEKGKLSNDEHVELIEGEIVPMSPIGRRHAGCVNKLNNLFGRILGDKAVVAVQNPVRLSIYSEPEPDIALLRPRADFYSASHPSPAEVLLIVEVADTSIGYDRETKVPLYARAGIPELWIVDLVGEAITQYTQPIRGKYQQQKQAKRGDHLKASTISNLTIMVDEILGLEMGTKSE